MSNRFSRREFMTAAGAFGGAAFLPAAAAADTPAPPARGSVILFQGDSITDGGRDRRAPEPNSVRCLGLGYPLLVASAALARYADRDLRFYNRGIAANRVQDLQARWAADTLALKPNVVSILIGVNDFWQKLTHGYRGTVAEYESQYAALLESTRRSLPAVRILVLEPFVLRCGAVDERWFPEFDQRRAAAARVAQKAGAIFVPLQKIFDDLSRRAPPDYWAADGVHPSPAGHGVIAERWRLAAKL